MDFFQPENSLNNLSRTSSVAMLFNGFFLEDKIKGYETLKVSGREVLSYQLSSNSNISGRDGSLILDKTLPDRLLKITYRIMAEDNKELQNQFRQLNSLLNTDSDVPIRFKDDMDFTFYGQVKDFADVADDSNNIVSTFTILCSNPYKFEKEYSITGNPAKIQKETFPTNPEKIKITLKEATNMIKLLNKKSGKKIILSHEYSANDIIIINISKNKITVNGESRMQDLAFEVTDFHGFTVEKDDEISVTPINSELEITVRSKWK